MVQIDEFLMLINDDIYGCAKSFDPTNLYKVSTSLQVIAIFTYIVDHFFQRSISNIDINVSGVSIFSTFVIDSHLSSRVLIFNPNCSILFKAFLIRVYSYRLDLSIAI